MKQDHYLIHIDHLRSLVRDRILLRNLEACGIDNYDMFEPSVDVTLETMTGMTHEEILKIARNKQ